MPDDAAQTNHLRGSRWQLSLRWKSFLTMLVVVGVLQGLLAFQGVKTLEAWSQRSRNEQIASFRGVFNGLLRRGVEEDNQLAAQFSATVSPKNLQSDAREQTVWSTELSSRLSSVSYFDISGQLIASSGALQGAESGAAGVDIGGETEEADGFGDIVVNGFHAAAHAVGLVPESGAAGVFHELGPPGAMRFGAGEGEEAWHVTPILAHADHGREEGVEDALVEEQAVGLGGDAGFDLRT